MSKQRMSKLQNMIITTLSDGDKYEYNHTAKYICATYMKEYTLTNWLLKNNALPEKFAVSFARAVKLLIKKGYVYPYSPVVYRRALMLQLTKNGVKYAKDNRMFRPEIEFKGYKWI